MPRARQVKPVRLYRQPVADVVTMAAGLLKKAKAGEVRALAIIYVAPSNRVAFNSALGDHTSHMLVAGAEYLRHDLVSRALSE